MSREHFYYIENGFLWCESENDGFAFMRRGPERTIELMCTVESAERLYPRELEKAKQINGQRHPD